ncbi:serine proteinase stubble [Euwallacea fornicatus]|uniref:serine proteinase stubble n=1 Tax=Euwallacea fornicatus TaxID=995702 RepID=UPI00338EFA8C
MLPATLVTLVTFILDLSSSSPVYNMQPAFITTNIASTNGRNIRNLPCVSRKNPALSGVCMFAIDCLKSNGTHLGTCIDRFYFGSCCHIEPIKALGNNIESNIVLDSREPPERLHNTTTNLFSSTPINFNNISSMIISSTIPGTGKPYPQTKKPNITTTENPPKTTKTTPTKSPPLVTKPYGVKLPSVPGTSFSTSPELTTVPQKLQTFQIIDGALLETTTLKSSRPATTKSPSTITEPRPAITAPHKPYQKPSTRPPKPEVPSKPTQKPSKPPKISSTTRRPAISSATSKTVSTRRPAATHPTRKVTRPSSTVKSSTISPSITTIKTPTRKPSVFLTKRPTTLKPSVSTTLLTISTASHSTSTLPSPPPPSKVSVPKKNLTQILENGAINSVADKVVETGGLLTVVNASSPASSTIKPSTAHVTTASAKPAITSSSSSSPIGSSSVTAMDTSSSKPTTSGTTTKSPGTRPATTSPRTTTKPADGVVVWSVDDAKNHTVFINETYVDHTTEDWVPIVTTNGWVLLPSVTPITPLFETNQSASPVTSSPTSAAIQPFSTIIPLVTSLSQGSSSTASASQATSSIASTTVTPVASSSLANAEQINGTILTSVTTEGSTAVTSTEVTGTTISIETSSLGTSTDITSEGKPINMSDFTDVCGRRMWPEARIVGGEKSSFGKWPWQISLRQWRTSTYLHKCGAALLNENWAITAAHCVDNVPPSDLLLRLGEHDLSTEGEPYLHEERRVQIVASHPQFDPRTFEYDLALLRFYEPVQFQPNIIPVCVPKSDENFVGRTAHVTGWGRLYEDGPLPSVLQEVSVPVINNTVCESMYRSAGYIEHIPHIFICAGWRKGGFDSCEGDSGGPMVIQREDKRFLLSGIISWGIGCAEPNQPGVYTRISEFRDWINQILQF